jgi:hypothetical protein
VLPVRDDAGSDLKFRFNEEGVKLDLGGERKETWPPGGRKGFRPDKSFKNEVEAMWEDPEGPATPEFPKAPPTP